MQARIEQFLGNIERRNKKVNALLYVNDDAISQAKEVDRKIKAGKAGRLAGLAVAVKANISVKGMPVSCASKALENYNGTFDSDVIAKIRAQDGIIIGMANMDEFACGSSGENSAFGPTDNPSAPGLIPGGSSSGPAAAVAANFCDIALGSDTGGSIRNPASHCGVVGIKPSYGRVSRYGLVDLSMSLDQIGPLSHDVYHSALMLEVISGLSENDATSVNAPVPKYSAELKEVKGLRIGICPEFEAMCSNKAISRLVSESAKNFADSTGSVIKDVVLPHVDLAVQAYYPLVYVEFFSGTRKFDGRKYGKKIEEHCGPEVLRRILGGKEISRAEYHGAYYRKALSARRLIAEEFKAAFRNVDVIVSPTTPMLPHKLGSGISDPRAMYAYDAFTIPANLAGICAGVVPCAKIGNVPVGVQVMAPAFREDVLLRVMGSLQNNNL